VEFRLAVIERIRLDNPNRQFFYWKLVRLKLVELLAFF